MTLQKKMDLRLLELNMATAAAAASTAAAGAGEEAGSDATAG